MNQFAQTIKCANFAFRMCSLRRRWGLAHTIRPIMDFSVNSESLSTFIPVPNSQLVAEWRKAYKL